jgi:antagonist of KipI
MSLRVIKSGVLDTIQDMGRYGFQYLGINPTGATDRFSAHIANALVGNDPHEAVIEMHFPAPVFLFQQAALISLSGADFSASINGEEVPIHHPIVVTKNCVLQFHEPGNGVRIYMAIQGGFKTEKWLNSSSTNLKAKAGGYKGRALQKDDEIYFNQILPVSFLSKEKEFLVLPWQADVNWHDSAYPDEIFVLTGNEWSRLTEDSKNKFFTEEFVINLNSDRMGYRVDADFLESMITDEIVSSAVNFGTIQLVPGKQLIILMTDHQTTGGYPRLANVITVHLYKIAQMQAGNKINFRLTDQQTAENLLIEQHRHLHQLEEACKFKLEEFFNK